MNKDFFKDFALSEENVYLLYNYCKADEASTKTVSAQLYQKELCGRDSPIIHFDHDRTIVHIHTICFMLGQLKAVHDGFPFMTPAQGFFSYTGEPWTKNQAAVFALYHLGLSFDFLSPFIYHDNVLYTDISCLPKTYPLNDPRHQESFRNTDASIKKWFAKINKEL